MTRHGDPTFLVVSGSRQDRLAALIGPLVAAGSSVVTLGGDTYRPRDARTVPELVQAIEAAEREHGPLQGIVAHGLGIAASRFALAHGVQTDRVAYVGGGVALYDAPEVADIASRWHLLLDACAGRPPRPDARSHHTRRVCVPGTPAHRLLGDDRVADVVATFMLAPL